MRRRRMPGAVKELAELVKVKPNGGSFWEVDFQPNDPKGVDLMVSVQLTTQGTLQVIVLSGCDQVQDITERIARTFERVRKKPLPPIVRDDRIIMQDILPEDVARLAKELAKHEGRTVELENVNAESVPSPVATGRDDHE